MTLRYIGLNWARPYEEEEPFLGGRGGPLCLFHPSNKIICYLSTKCMYKRMIFFYFSDPIKCSGQSSMDLIWQETGKVATKICRNSAWVHAIHTHTGVWKHDYIVSSRLNAIHTHTRVWKHYYIVSSRYSAIHTHTGVWKHDYIVSAGVPTIQTISGFWKHDNIVTDW